MHVCCVYVLIFLIRLIILPRRRHGKNHNHSILVKHGTTGMMMWWFKTKPGWRPPYYERHNFPMQNRKQKSLKNNPNPNRGLHWNNAWDNPLHGLYMRLLVSIKSTPVQYFNQHEFLVMSLIHSETTGCVHSVAHRYCVHLKRGTDSASIECSWVGNEGKESQ